MGWLSEWIGYLHAGPDDQSSSNSKWDMARQLLAEAKCQQNHRRSSTSSLSPMASKELSLLDVYDRSNAEPMAHGRQNPMLSSLSMGNRNIATMQCDAEGKLVTDGTNSLGISMGMTVVNLVAMILLYRAL